MRVPRASAWSSGRGNRRPGGEGQPARGAPVRTTATAFPSMRGERQYHGHSTHGDRHRASLSPRDESNPPEHHRPTSKNESSTKSDLRRSEKPQRTLLGFASAGTSVSL